MHLHRTESINPLQNVQLFNATSSYLVFDWTKASNCSSELYIVAASKECGICPNHTSSTQVQCFLSENVTNEQKICEFKVDIAPCGDFHGWKFESNTIAVNLKCKCNCMHTIATGTYRNSRIFCYASISYDKVIIFGPTTPYIKMRLIFACLIFGLAMLPKNIILTAKIS